MKILTWDNLGVHGLPRRQCACLEIVCTPSEHVSSTHVVISVRAHSLHSEASARSSVGAVVLHAGHIHAG